MILLALSLVPLLGGGALFLLRRRAAADPVHLATAVVTAALAASVVWEVASGSTPRGPLLALRADALSAFMIGLVAAVSLLGALALPAYLRTEIGAGRVSAGRAGGGRALFHVFVATMLLAVSTDSIGVMWVAVEGTTLASVFLISLERRRGSLEAAYKYLLICSVGIAVAFMGTVVVYLADVVPMGAGGRVLEWSSLVEVAPRLSPRLMRLAFVLLLIGYGTKAGLAPMHTWLPDAHSEAPAPVSALMSGVLLAVGLYALLRLKVVTDLALGRGFADGLLLGFGLTSLVVAAVFMWIPRSYKRMLAYSSVEHVGVVCVGLGLGSAAGAMAALLHLLGHGLAKAPLFLLSGRVLQRFGSHEVARVRGLGRAMPWTGGTLLVGTLALLGLPPSALFLSEVLVIRAGLASPRPWAAAVVVVVLVAAFGGMLRVLHRMLPGVPPAEVPVGEPVPWALLPAWGSLALLAGLGLALPAPLWEALRHVAALLESGGAGR